MTSGEKKQARNDKLRSALRDNLKKRKAQARKIGGEDAGNSVSLRDRDLAAHDKKDMSS